MRAVGKFDRTFERSAQGACVRKIVLTQGAVPVFTCGDNVGRIDSGTQLRQRGARCVFVLGLNCSESAGEVVDGEIANRSNASAIDYLHGVWVRRSARLD